MPTIAILSKKIIQDDETTKKMKSDIPKFLNKGIELAQANTYVSTWFGSGATERQTLRQGLLKIKKILDSGAALQLSSGSGDEYWNEDTMGSSYCYGMDENLKHSRVEIFVGKAHKDSSYAEKVHTIFHEMTHRILSTDDIKYNNQTCYGTAKCKQLAINKPSDAIKNADSWAFFLKHANNDFQ